MLWWWWLSMLLANLGTSFGWMSSSSRILKAGFDAAGSSSCCCLALGTRRRGPSMGADGLTRSSGVPTTFLCAAKSPDKDNNNVFPKVTFREAEPSDLETLLRWEASDHVKEHAGDEEYNDWNWEYELPRRPAWRHQWIAMADNSSGSTTTQQEESDIVPIGIVQIIDPALEESHYWGTQSIPTEKMEDDDKIFTKMEPHLLRAVDIWIGEKEFLGKGYGTSMMTLVLNFCFARHPGVQAVIVDPMIDNQRAHNFYQKCGFRPVEERFFGPDHCLVHCISRDSWKERYK